MSFKTLPKIWHNFSKILLEVIILTFLLITCISCKAQEKKTPDSIGIYGGSISWQPQSDSSKLYWTANLNMPVYTFSESGCGFTNYSRKPVVSQIQQAPVTRVVIFWCSTNDFKYNTENENDLYDPTTQNGGIRLAYKEVLKKDPATIVLLFTSLPTFDGRDGRKTVEGQIKVCKELNIPYLDQFNFFSVNNTAEFYMPDKTHLKASAYLKIRERQLEFIQHNLAD